MTSLIVLFPKIEDARSIRNLLIKTGYSVEGVCTTGAQALQLSQSLNDGIIICGYKVADMMYTELLEYLPTNFEMLLVASRGHWEHARDAKVVCIEMPLQVNSFISTVGMMVETMERRRRKRRQMPKQRSATEQKLIDDAKALLMERNNMSEADAHKYLQKTSMDSGTDLTETAQMILALMDNV